MDGQLGIGDPVTLTTWVGATETPGFDSDELALNVNAGWSSRAVRASLQFQQFGENFNPEVGFLPRTGHRYYQAFGMYYIRRDSDTGLREIRPHVSYFTYRSMKDGVPDNFEETSRLHVDAHFEWQDGMLFSPAMNWVREGLFEPFTIPGTDVTVNPGTYDGWEAAWRFNTDPSANFAFDGGLDLGDVLSGTRKGASRTSQRVSGPS